MIDLTWNRSTTSSAATVSERGEPSEMTIKMSQLQDWEMMTRASLGVINHLDWFVLTVGKILTKCDVDRERKTDLDDLLHYSSMAVSHLAELQAKLLASNATVRREAILSSSHLSPAAVMYLRGQPIGCTDLFGGPSAVAEALRISSEEKRKVTKASPKKAGSTGTSGAQQRSRHTNGEGGFTSPSAPGSSGAQQRSRHTHGEGRFTSPSAPGSSGAQQPSRHANGEGRFTSPSAPRTSGAQQRPRPTNREGRIAAPQPASRRTALAPKAFPDSSPRRREER